MPGELLLDTGGIVSLLDRSQDRHIACVRVFEKWSRPVLTTEAVITEATHLLGRFAGGASSVLGFVIRWDFSTLRWGRNRGFRVYPS